jgi:hypothetical protein
MVGQKEWIKKNYINIKAWVCRCGRDAMLHTCLNGKHRFWCYECSKRYYETHGYANG